MDDLENTVALIFTFISSVVILIYYLNSKQSNCLDCNSVISHQKENRYRITVNGEENALCKKCFNRRQKQDELVAQNCSCCSKEFTTRMKIHEWDIGSELCFLCSTCNRKGESQLKSNFQLIEVLTDNFIQNNTGVNSLQEYVDSSNIEIDHQNDLNSQEWDNFIVKSTKFPSWKAMEAKALSELYSKQKSSIIDELCKST